MKFVVTTENLANGLKRVMPAINGKPSNPVLANILFVVDGECVTIAGSDFDVRIETKVPAIVMQQGAITLPAKKLQQIVGVLPSGDVEISTEDEESQTVSLVCRKAHYKVHGLAAADYPSAEEFKADWGFAMPIRELLSSFSKVSYARSTDEGRKELNGVLLSLRGGLMTVAATDGRRLALVEKPFQQEMENTVEGDVILSFKSVSELLKCLGQDEEVKVGLNQSMASFESTNTRIFTRLREGRYPNFRSVIPTSFTQKVAISRLGFIDVLTRVATIVAGSENPTMVFDIGASEMLISASSHEFGEAQEAMEISLEGNPVQICFNPDFLIEPLKFLECDQLVIKLNDVFNPVAIEGDEGFIYVLMPIKAPTA